jgi:hypothetical protein
MKFAGAWIIGTHISEPTRLKQPDPFWIGLFLCLVTLPCWRRS